MEIPSMSRSKDTAINRLIARKKSIEKRIMEELKRPLPDTLKLQDLKRVRLDLKDRLSQTMKSQPTKGLSISVRVN